MELQMRNIPSLPGQTLGMISDNFPETSRHRWRIYCLTPLPGLTLMWSHYADHHRCICFEFSSDNNPLFAQAWQVIDRGAYPRFELHAMNNAIEILRTKSNDWLYENEYRIIVPVRTPDLPQSWNAGRRWGFH